MAHLDTLVVGASRERIDMLILQWVMRLTSVKMKMEWTDDFEPVLWDVNNSFYKIKSKESRSKGSNFSRIKFEPGWSRKGNMIGLFANMSKSASEDNWRRQVRLWCWGSELSKHVRLYNVRISTSQIWSSKHNRYRIKQTIFIIIHYLLSEKHNRSLQTEWIAQEKVCK